MSGRKTSRQRAGGELGGAWGTVAAAAAKSNIEARNSKHSNWRKAAMIETAPTLRAKPRSGGLQTADFLCSDGAVSPSDAAYEIHSYYADTAASLQLAPHRSAPKEDGGL